MSTTHHIRNEAIPFIKMHGIGNDYVYINCMESMPDRLPELAREMSDRHFGIGSDGIVLICPSTDPRAHYRMRMFNSDGSEARMCGNASRCIAALLHNHAICSLNPINLETLSGIKVLTLNLEGDRLISVTVDMGAPEFLPELIPVLYEGKSMIEKPVRVGDMTINVTAVSMGNPHCVVFEDVSGQYDFCRVGPALEKHPLFPDRANVEFAHIGCDGSITIRVWERGTGETLACGTGACATVAAAVHSGRVEKGKDVTVHLRGGDLAVCMTDETIKMTGPATEVFSGNYYRRV